MGKHQLAAKDLFKLRFISDPQMAPDGNRIAYVQTRIDPKSKEYRTGIYVYEENGQSRCVVSDGQRPSWAYDGTKLAYLSSRSGSKQVWLTSETLGEPRQLTTMLHGVSNFSWSPDGTKILLLCGCDHEEDDPEALLKEASQEEKTEKAQALRDEPLPVDQIYYKADEIGGLLPRHRKQLWLLDMETKEAVRISNEKEHIYSRMAVTPVWSPNGRYIAYTSRHKAEKEMTPFRAANAADLFLYDVEEGTEKRLVKGDGAAAYPVWSPDSCCLAYFWYDDLSYATSATIPSLHRMCIEDEKGECLNSNHMVSVHIPVQSDLLHGFMPAQPVWTQSGKILFWGAEKGTAQIYQVPDTGGEVSTLSNFNGSVFGFSGDISGRRLAVAVMEHTSPMEIYDCYSETGFGQLCVNANEQFLKDAKLAMPEEFTFKTSDQEMVQGWFMKPFHEEEKGKFPVILSIHGGPHLLYGNAFNFEFQLMAAKGFGVVYLNPRGSAGYGQEFLRGCCGDFGGRDYEDLMEAVDVLVDKEQNMDRDRLGVTGLSYGGYMTNWIVSQNDRFSAAVTKNCLSNLMSFSGVSDIGYFFLEAEQLGSPWKDNDKMKDRSPLTHVENINTPLLIMHTEQDQRCPIEQSEQLFTAMKYFEKEVHFLRFPSGNHLMYRQGRPVLRVSWLKETMDWFVRHLT